MNRFAGWVQMPRQHLQNVLNDEITGLEHYALMVLTLLADAATGGDRINAPVLAYFCGQAFNHDTAGRILSRLHDKGCIWYRAKRYSKKPQPYWVNGYVMTRGLHKLRRINLSQLYEKETISQQDVWKSAVQPTEQDTVQPTEQGADNYKKRYKRMKTNKSTSTGSEYAMSASLNATQSAPCSVHDAGMDEAGMLPSCAHDASIMRPLCIHPETVQDTAEPWKWGDPLLGYEFVTGGDPVYRCLTTGRALGYEQAQAISRTAQ